MRKRQTFTSHAGKNRSTAHKAGRRQQRYHLKNLLNGITKKNIHPGIDFGPPVGREVL